MLGFDPYLQQRIHATPHALLISTFGVGIIYGWNQAEGSSDLRPKLEVGQRANRKYRLLRHFPLPNDGDRQKGILLVGSPHTLHSQNSKYDTTVILTLTPFTVNIWLE